MFSVKQNPFLERDFIGTLQNSANDLQSYARYDDLQNITNNLPIAGFQKSDYCPA